MPTPACNRRSGAGTYQAARPSSRSIAGTSTPRTTVASMSTAAPAPGPNICRKLTELVPNAKKLTASGNAAVDTIRPVRARPCVIAVTGSAPSSCNSLTRLRERRAGRITPADWSWIVPPLSGSATPVFHRYDDADQRPNFYVDAAARRRVAAGCPVVEHE